MFNIIPLPTVISRPVECMAQIIALGAVYFVAVSSLDIISNVGTIDDLTSTARIVLILPVAVLDAVFILWVFTSLSRTLNQLQARRAAYKLVLYRFLCAALVTLALRLSLFMTLSHAGILQIRWRSWSGSASPGSRTRCTSR